ncbi:hypothetical protein Q5P01_022935 [Channa striata]|uniref:Uncharacterized protein n=1 Tax=Channa striata TaxID=64152 RepID=A0AA88LS02_CHASR|nr:hypothetical protein Q5P01_022935 [Channa striata]
MKPNDPPTQAVNTEDTLTHVQLIFRETAAFVGLLVLRLIRTRSSVSAGCRTASGNRKSSCTESVPAQHVCEKDEVLTVQLCDQETDSSLDQGEPEPLQEEVCSSREGQQLVPNQMI